jgi:hypothetical protein
MEERVRLQATEANDSNQFDPQRRLFKPHHLKISLEVYPYPQSNLARTKCP